METIHDLIESYIEMYNEYLINTIDYPDEADDDYSCFCDIEEKIIDYFGIKQKSYPYNVLRRFIDESCYEDRIPYTKKLETQIIYTMKLFKVDVIKLCKMPVNEVLSNEFYLFQNELRVL